MNNLIKDIIKGMYQIDSKNPITQIIMRELFQNAIDAIYARHQKEPSAHLWIKIFITKYGTVVWDTGTGMDERELKYAFGTLGTSMKELGSAGFYGIGGKSTMGSARNMFIISYHDEQKPGNILKLYSVGGELKYELKPFPNLRKTKGTVIFYRNKMVDFDYLDPTMIFTPWYYELPLKTSYNEELYEAVMLARYYSFWAYENGWDVKIWVNGRRLSLTKKEIDEMYYSFEKGKRKIFVSKAGRLTIKNTYEHLVNLLVFVNVRGITYPFFLSRKIKTLVPLNVFSSSGDLYDSPLLEMVVIDPSITFSPARRAEELKEFVNTDNIMEYYEYFIHKLTEEFSEADVIYRKYNKIKVMHKKLNEGELSYLFKGILPESLSSEIGIKECLINNNTYVVLRKGNMYLLQSYYASTLRCTISGSDEYLPVSEEDVLSIEDYILWNHYIYPVPGYIKEGRKFFYFPDMQSRHSIDEISPNHSKRKYPYLIFPPDGNKKLLVYNYNFPTDIKKIINISERIENFPEHVPNQPGYMEFLEPMPLVPKEQISLERFGIRIDETAVTQRQVARKTEISPKLKQMDLFDFLR